MLALARTDAVRADREWLKLRLLRPEQSDTLAATKQQLDLATQRAQRSSRALSDLAPDDPKTARARIDAARLSGDLASARSLLRARVEWLASPRPSTCSPRSIWRKTRPTGPL